ncbi:MAG TPA: 30S ribosomal protein S20 [Thermodesulfobacteriaceae bacterium]|nr:30S ribosomal protein S20 [Thermodesulfobacteriaceae bacterium]
MANHKSALKRIRQNKKRRLRNKSRKTRVKNLIKAVEAAVENRSLEEAKEKLHLAQKIIDKTAGKKVLHRKTAARKISRISRKVHALAQALTG